MSYYSILRYLEPKNIVEIGSGFSTLVALQAVSRNGNAGKVTCVEPYPRDFIVRNPDINLVQKPAQEIEPDYLNDTLRDGDVLFIDSTHTVKHNSDCLRIYLKLLPQIRHDIHVHVHDIYLPQPYSLQMMRDRQIYWTEQYLLAAYLTGNSRTKILYGSNYLQLRHPERLAAFMHGRQKPGGASLWFSQKAKA
nr:class I SAM-dependent methyltransferase [Aquisalinus flavus]